MSGQSPAVYNAGVGYPVNQEIDGNLTLRDPSGTGQYGNLSVPSLSLGTAVLSSIREWYQPTGVAAIDTASLNNALGSYKRADVLPGAVKINAPLIINSSSVSFHGSGNHATTITCVASSAIPAMLIAGNTQILQNLDVGDFQLFGNANSGHNIAWRASNSKLADVILQDPSGDCLRIDPNAAFGGSINQDVFSNILGITPGGNGWWSDKITDSDIYSLTVDGGPPNTLGGNIGINVTSGANLRFHGPHAYLFANGGASIAGSQHSMIGGELESNGTADLIVNGAIFCTFSQVVFYDQANAASPPNQHIHVTGNAAHIDIADCPWYPAAVSIPNFLVVDAGSSAYAHDCLRYNPAGLQTPPTYTSGSATTNPFPFRCRVVAGSSTTLTALNGTTLGTAATVLEVAQGENVTPTGAGGSWQWFGL